MTGVTDVYNMDVGVPEDVGANSSGGDSIWTAGVSAETDKHEYENELQHKISQLESKVKSLESERIHLVGLVAEGNKTRTTVSVGTDTECREDTIGHAPASIMSLSTGSEESAVEDEKFVKIKSCEIETSSSKSSSQSDKENFELEEQTQHFIEEIESLKKVLQKRDEAFKIIKLELEAALLEKSVESQSISTVSSEVKSMKQSLIAKDEELDEIVLVLDDVLEQMKSYIPNNADQAVESVSLECKLNLVKEIPNILKMLEAEMKKKQVTLEEVSSEFQELQDQQNEVIGGYQLVSENYAKLQAEFDEFKESVSSSTTDGINSEQVNEELQRFREELISKDDDLEELQTRSEDLQQRLTLIEKENEDLLKKVQEFESVKTEEMVKKVDKSVETEILDTTDTSPLQLPEENICSAEHSSYLLSRSRSEEVEGPVPIKKLQHKCLEQLRVTELNRELRESSLQKKLNELMTENSDLSLRLSSLENDTKKKNVEIEQLLLSVENYRDAIERKTEVINMTITSKQKEVETLMSTYNAYYEGKEKLVSDLTSDIQQRDAMIQSLEAQHLTELEKRNLEKYRVDEELQYLKNNLSEMDYTYQTQLQQLREKLVSVQEREKYLTALSNTLQRQFKDNQGQIEDLKREKEEADLALERFGEVSSLAEMQQIQLRRSQDEHMRALTFLQLKESNAEEEFVRNKKEAETLRESESLAFQQQIDILNHKLKYYKSEFIKFNELITKLKAEKQNYQKEIAAVQVEKESLQFELNVLSDTLKQNHALILNFETTSAEMKEEILKLQNLCEAHSRVIPAPEELVEKNSPVPSSYSSSEEFRDSANIIKLQEEIRILNESNIIKDRKIELLQAKISEIERSEIKAFEESFMLKGWVRQLELDNLRYQDELKVLTNDETNENPKVKKLQDETMRLIYALDDRDKRCVQLTLEITRLLEERDGLQLKLSNVLKHNVELTVERRSEGRAPEEGPIYDKVDLQNKLAQLEDTNFQINIDLRREREARKLVQEQLLFSQTSRTYRMRERNLNSSLTISSSQTKSSSSSGSISSFDSGHASPDEHAARSHVGNSDRYGNEQVV